MALIHLEDRGKVELAVTLHDLDQAFLNTGLPYRLRHEQQAVARPRNLVDLDLESHFANRPPLAHINQADAIVLPCSTRRGANNTRAMCSCSVMLMVMVLEPLIGRGCAGGVIVAHNTHTHTHVPCCPLPWFDHQGSRQC